MKKVKVLFFVSTLESSGPTNVVYNIIKYLNRDHITPVILTMSPEPEKSKKEQFETMGIEVVLGNQGRLSSILDRGKKLKQLILRIAPDIIHGHSLRPDLFNAKFMKNFFRISTLHADLKANYSDTYNAITGSYLAWRHLEGVKRIEKVVAVSRSVFNLYKNEIDSLDCIPNGVDRDIFYPIPESMVERSRIELGLPLKNKIFISVGALTNRKDPVTCVEGFLNRENSAEQLLLMLGTGNLGKELIQRYRSYKNVIFLGFVSDVVKYLQVSDFFISASTSEGLPNSVLEALSCGLPVCLSDIPSHMDILSLNNEAGHFFECGNPLTLSKAIDKISATSRGRQAALKLIEEEFNAHLMSNKYEHIYLNS